MNKKFFGDFNQAGVDGQPNQQPALVHIAGPMVDNVQQCTRCGKVLIDARKANSKGGEPAKGFQEGQDVTVEGSKIIGGAVTETPRCAEPMTKSAA